MCLDGINWYILVTNDLRWSESQLISNNIAREEREITPFHYFIPYSTSKDQRYSVLRRFIFIEADLESLKEFQNRVNYLNEGKYIWFYKNRQKELITVSSKVMQKFIAVCTHNNGSIEFSAELDEKIIHQEIMLNSTPFRGEKAYVLEVRHTKEGVNLTLGLKLANGAIMLRMKDIKERDIIFVHEEDRIQRADILIHNIQQQMLPIISRKVYSKGTERNKKEDYTTLNMVSNYRYHTIEDPDLQNTFTALMLICAHLRKDIMWEKELHRIIEKQLKSVKQEITNDADCWMIVSMYVSTGNPEYRNKAKKYVQSTEVSEELHCIVNLIRKNRIK